MDNNNPTDNTRPLTPSSVTVVQIGYKQDTDEVALVVRHQNGDLDILIFDRVTAPPCKEGDVITIRPTFGTDPN